MSEPTRLTLAVDQGTGLPRSHSCGRCTTMAVQARERGLVGPPVRSVETWVHQSVRYFGALCRECADWDWSARWFALYDAASGNVEEQQRLGRERQRRIARGREFHALARGRSRPES